MPILLAFSTGRPRNGPRSYHKSASRNIACASLIGMRRGHIYTSHLSHIIIVLFIQIEFPRLLAKREIIANALFLPTMSLEVKHESH